jgi:hypothetical protein
MNRMKLAMLYLQYRKHLRYLVPALVLVVALVVYLVWMR